MTDDLNDLSGLDGFRSISQLSGEAAAEWRREFEKEGCYESGLDRGHLLADDRIPVFPACCLPGKGHGYDAEKGYGSGKFRRERGSGHEGRGGI